jgi:hypothetical protein
MVVDLPRRWRWAIGGACGAVLLLGLVFVGLTRTDVGAASAAPPPVAGVAADPATVVADGPARATPVAAGGERHGVDEVQVCGGAWVRAQPDGSIDRAEFERAAQLPQWRERILATLQSSAGELARASFVLLATPDADRADALARQALSSTDARVYALAFKVCGGSSGRGEGACRMLSAEQWARLDPDNAAPWQFIFAAAAARGDRAAQDDALFRMASARRSALGYFDVAGAVLEATPDDEASTLAAWAMVTEAIGVESAVALSGMQPLVQACKGSALRDANRAQICASLAEAMTERSDTLLERMIGAAIGRQIGWPAERTDRVRGEYSAYSAQTAPLPGDGNEFGCARIRRDLDTVRRHATLGEVGAMRAWVVASGKTPAHFVGEERAHRQQAEAAASAASGAGR